MWGNKLDLLLVIIDLFQFMKPYFHRATHEVFVRAPNSKGWDSSVLAGIINPQRISLGFCENKCVMWV